MNTTTQYQIIAAAIGVAVILFEIWFRILRRRRPSRVAETRKARSGDDFDEAYNAIASTEKISAVLKAQGVDTTEAELAIAAAKRARARGDRELAVSKASAARSAMMEAKKYTASRQPPVRPAVDISAAAETEEEEGGGEGPEDPPPAETPSEEAPKLPENYMQSKFMIATAEGAVKSAASDGRATAGVEKSLAEAKAAFGREEYGKALSLALKARKLADGISPSARPEGEGPVVLDVGAPLSDPAAQQREAGEAGAKPKESEKMACPGCEAGVDEEDAFCRKCGGKLEFKLECHRCGTELDKGDAFCRKCGEKTA